MSENARGGESNSVSQRRNAAMTALTKEAWRIYKELLFNGFYVLGSSAVLYATLRVVAQVITILCAALKRFIPSTLKKKVSRIYREIFPPPQKNK